MEIDFQEKTTMDSKKIDFKKKTLMDNGSEF